MSHGEEKSTTSVSVYSILGGASYLLSAALCGLTGLKIGQFGRIMARTEELERSADDNKAFIQNAHAFLRAHGIDVPPEATSGSAANVTSSPGIGDGR